MLARELLEVIKLGKTRQTRAKALTKKLYRDHHRNPLNPDEFLIAMEVDPKTRQMTEYCVVELYPDVEFDETIYLKWLVASTQRKGYGRKAMEYLMDYARKAKVSISLIPWENGNEADLIRLYTSLGFKHLNSDDHDLRYMIWHP